MDKSKKKIGLAKLTPQRRKQIARKGGKTVQKLGLANTFTSETATKAVNKRWRKYRAEHPKKKK